MAESKPQINRRKYAQLGIASLAAVALIIGLSVGLSQRNSNTNNVSSSNAAYESYETDDCDEPVTLRRRRVRDEEKEEETAALDLRDEEASERKEEDDAKRVRRLSFE